MIDSLESRGIAYQVYVMRFWQEQIDSPVWRFSLEDPNTGHQRGFSCLTELVAYLEGETGYFAQENFGTTQRRNNPCIPE